MIEYTKHNVFIEILDSGNFPASASLSVRTFPNGSTKAANLDATQLREIAHRTYDEVRTGDTSTVGGIED